MTSIDDARLAAEDAAREAQEAAEFAAELEQRLVHGDDTITPAQLDEQHRTSRWAHLRAEGAAKRHQQAAAAQQLADARSSVDEIAALGVGDDELVAAWTAAATALQALARAALARTDAVRTNQAELEAVDSRLRSNKLAPIGSLGVLPALFGGEYGYRMPDRGVAVHDVRPVDLIATAIERGMQAAALNISGITIDRYRQLPGSTLAARIPGWDAAARALDQGGSA